MMSSPKITFQGNEAADYLGLVGLFEALDTKTTIKEKRALFSRQIVMLLSR